MPRHYLVLDGARGLAIALVLHHHFSAGAGHGLVERLFSTSASVGWCGVDLFFVLSGFLITGLLDDARGGLLFGYFRDFYVRRALRIFPLYYVFLLVVFAALPWAVSALPAGYPRERLGFFFYLQNFAYARAGNLGWAVAGSTWSLAIEEQFYLVWPLVVRSLRRRALLRACLAIAAVSLALRIVLLAGGASSTLLYVMPFTRADGLALGGAAALLLREGVDPSRLLRAARRGCAAGLGGFALLVLVRRSTSHADAWVQTAGYSLLALGFASLLTWAVLAPEGRLARLLSNGALRTLGKYSYAIYLVHLGVRDLLMRVVDPSNSPLLGFR